MSSEVWKVLVVHSNPEIRAEVCRLLLSGSNRRCELAYAPTGAVAIPLAEDQDCIFLAHSLPDMEAPDVLGALCRGQSVTCAPVVVLTGTHEPQAIAELLQAGAMEWLNEDSLTPDSVTRAVEHAVARHTIQRQPHAAGYYSTSARSTNVAHADSAEPKQTEAALRESEQRYRTLFEAIDEGFCVIEVIVNDAGTAIDYRFLEINPAFEGQTGIRNAVGRRMREIAPTHEAHWFDIYGRVAQTGEGVRFQKPAEALDRYYDAYAFRVGAPEQRRVAVLFNDITDRMLANAERQQFFNLSSALLVEAGFDGRFHRVNPAWERLLGWTSEELTSRPWIDFVHPEDRAASEAAAGQLLYGVEVVNFENRYRHKDGSYRWINWNTSASQDHLTIYAVAHDVSARKESEEQLRRSHDTFFGLIQNAPFGVYLVDSQFRLVQVSVGSHKVFGNIWPLIGRDISEVLRLAWPEQCANEAIERFRHTLATGEPYHSTDTTDQRVDSSTFETYDWRIERITLPDGQFGMVCYFYELTELRRAQEAQRLAAEADRFRAALADALRLSTDPVEIQTSVSRMLGEHLGASRVWCAEIVESSEYGIIHAEYHSTAPSVIGRHRLDGYSTAVMNDIRAGKTLVVSDARDDPRFTAIEKAVMTELSIGASVVIPLGKFGEPRAALGVDRVRAHQWTPEELALIEETAERTCAAVERARVEVALREREARFRQIFETAGVSVWVEDFTEVRKAIDELTAQGITDLRGYFATHPDFIRHTIGLVRVLDVNQETLTLFGAEDKADLLQSFDRIFTSDTEVVFADELVALAEGRETWRAETLMQTLDGRSISVLVTLHFSPQGDSGRVVVTLTDITLRKAAELTLRESEHRFRMMADKIPAMLWITEPDGSTSFLSRRWYEYTGQSEEQALGFGWLDAVHPDDREQTERMFYGVNAKHDPFVLDYRARRFDGEYRWVIDTGSPRFGESGEFLGYIGCVMDVHERKQAEAALRSAERLEAVGRLAGGVAHEANNQMTVVLGCAEFALKEPNLPPAVLEELEQIRRAGERTAGITRQLLAFSRRQVLRPAAMDLNATIQEFEPVLRRMLTESTTLTMTLATRLGAVVADRGQIEQVLVNLVLNARDAMPSGGTLAIETDTIELRDDATGNAIGDAAPESLPPGGYAVLDISDTGVGIAAAALPRVFEPFFTTKPVGEGTGLGLSTAYGIVNQLGGAIAVRSTLGHGATFRVYLPLASEVTPRPPRSESAAPARCLGTILVVEDEPEVRNLAARALISAGYDVLKAEDGRTALELLARHEGTLAAVVADVVMPEMGGSELARRLAESYPGVPVLLMSGYPLGVPASPRALNGSAIPMLQKPFHPGTLVERVRELVANHMGLSDSP